MLLYFFACTPEEKPPDSEAEASLCDMEEGGTIVFPEDDGPHAGSPRERWSWAGWFLDSGSQSYWVNLEFLLVDGILTATSSLILEGSRQLSLEDQNPELGSGSGFSFEVGAASASGAEGRDLILATTGEFQWELVLAQRKAPILHQESSKWTGYSRPRMSARGHVSGPDGERLEVEGEVWFEHVWGGGGGPEQRVMLSLDGGRDLRFLLDGGQVIAQGEDADCRAFSPAEADFVVDLQWTSAATGCVWPNAGTLSADGESWALAPLLQDQELSPATGSFWWGAMAVSGSGTGSAWVRAEGDCP